jgi:hypothetical protein
MHIRYLIWLLLLFPLSAGADSEKSHFTKHYEGSIFKVTEKGLFSIEMIVKEELQTGVNAVEIIVHDASDKDVVGAEISAVPWMPAMGHGVSQKPTVTERGGGLYRVGDIIFIMGGHWELRIKVKKDDTEDLAVFDFPEVAAYHTHALTAPAQKDIDTEATRTSARGLFVVSYTSEPSQIPLNKIHAWKITVSNPDGKPVSGARISLSGDMPEHGHGLPTQPEVTQEIEKGAYLVEGMKFSMPGWWVVMFTIKADGMEDTVTFNLLLK